MTVQDETTGKTESAVAASTSPSPLAQLMELATKLQEQSSTSTSATTSPLTEGTAGTVVATTNATTLKAGVTTSEFLLTLASDVAATVLLLTHNLTATEWTAITGGTAAIYAAARTWLKG